MERKKRINLRIREEVLKRKKKEEGDLAIFVRNFPPVGVVWGGGVGGKGEKRGIFQDLREKNYEEKEVACRKTPTFQEGKETIQGRGKKEEKASLSHYSYYLTSSRVSMVKTPLGGGGGQRLVSILTGGLSNGENEEKSFPRLKEPPAQMRRVDA